MQSAIPAIFNWSRAISSEINSSLTSKRNGKSRKRLKDNLKKGVAAPTWSGGILT